MIPATPAVALPTLDALPLHQPGRVVAVEAGPAGQPAQRLRQLADIGFVPGERVTVVAAAWPGHDPLVVRVGTARFALRRAEAACVRVAVGDGTPAEGARP